MSQSNITIRIDDEVRKEADELLSQMGLTLTSAFNIFIRQVIRTEGIPFDISAKRENPWLTKSEEDRLERMIKEMDAGKGIEHELIQVNE